MNGNWIDSQLVALVIGHGVHRVADRPWRAVVVNIDPNIMKRNDHPFVRDEMDLDYAEHSQRAGDEWTNNVAKLWDPRRDN